MLVTLKSKMGNTILKQLLKDGYSLPYMPCGGKGLCGKCRVTVKSGTVSPLTKNELKFKDLKENQRLACQAEFSGTIVVEIPDSTGEGNFLSSYIGKFILSKDSQEPGHFAFAVDIGTTTLAIALIDLKDGKVVDIVSRMNDQEKYGADVISRIGYVTTSSALKEVTDTIQNQLKNLFAGMLKKNNINPQNVTRISVAGNTTMSHLLVGADPTGIGVCPYTPNFLESRKYNADELGFGLPKASVFLTGGISSYVGGDITSGIGGLDLLNDNKTKILIDLGTNGEIALYNGEKIFSCSCAAGPVFEGANLACGMPGIVGAISHFKDEDGKISYTTIGDKKALGICGSGIIDIMSILLEKEIVDETGYMEGGRFWIEGTDIYVDPKDVRQIQLAKSAISAGVETLLDFAGMKIGDIERVYLAGGLGTYLDSENAMEVGILESKWKGRIISCGNSSLNGAISVIMDPEKEKTMEEIRKNAGYLELSTSARFQELFVENMIFGNKQ